MAKQVTPIPFVGRIGNLIYYKRNGKFYVRSAVFASKERMKEGPEFENTRKNNCEFAGCSTAARDFRRALGALLEEHADTMLSSRLTALFGKVIRHGRGKFGSRMIEVYKHKEYLLGFQFRKAVSFDSVFPANIEYASEASRKEVSMSIDSIHLRAIATSKGVSHYRIFIAAVAFSNFRLDKRTKKYKPVNKSVHETMEVQFSEFLPLKEKINHLTISTALPVKKAIPSTTGIFVIAGIQFFKEENNVMYSMPAKNYMKIAEVI